MNLSDVARISGGKLVGKDAEISSFCSNSKECSRSSLFFALKGSKRDGHDFIPQVYEVGGYAVSERDLDFSPYVKVKNSLQALSTLAFYKIKDSFRIAVTGSCGKTTTKEIIAHLLGKHARVCKSFENLNTDVGISLSLLNGPDDPLYAVLEMGARFPGDIAQLSSTFKPHVSVITCVGSSHSKYIDPMVEKSSIVEYTEKFVLYNEDQGLKKFLGTKGRTLRRHVKSFEYENFKTIVKVNGKNYALTGIWGKGQIEDLEFALTLMDELGMKWDLRDLEDFRFLKGRMNVKRVKKYVIIDDTYNSSLESFFNSTQTAFKLRANKTIWILAPMEEMKEDNISNYLSKIKSSLNPKAVFTVGKDFYPFGQKYSFQRLSEILEDGDLILIKGSRVYAMEKIVEEIERHL